MFRILRKLFARWFTRTERTIFKYHDGRRDRQADPLAVLEQLRTFDGFDIERDLNLIDIGDPEATAITLKAVRAAFGVTAWTEHAAGLTQGETINLLATFLEYLESLKKKHQSAADFAITFGIVALGAISHEQRVGLWLNRDRAEKRTAARVMMGVSCLFGDGLNRAWFEAMSETPIQAAIEFGKYQLAQANKE